ncbi:MAG: response regulator transcription factor [Anaeroplasmataceae bacterium]
MRLLLCEDEKMLSKVLTVLLKSNNFSVDAAYDGMEALEYIKTGIYDGIILDVMMPKMDGIEVLKKIRSEGIKTPVLMLTAKTEVEDKVLGLDSGADDYLTKPFETKELLARIRAMIRRGKEQTDSILSYEDLKLNRLTFTLSNEAKEIRLQNKEFQIMEMLMLNPSHIISTEQFMEKIWGFDSDTEITVVWVYVSYLRKKLKELNSNITIKVIRNAGYKLGLVDD